jgi:ABC-type nickel/cobalt efflux system permease component RcnA
MAKNAADQRKIVKANNIPILLEFVFTFSQLIIVIIGIVVATVSILSGNNLWMTVLQTGTAILVVGLLIWLASWMVSEGLLESTLSKMKEEAEKDAAEKLAAKAAQKEASRVESVNETENV